MSAAPEPAGTGGRYMAAPSRAAAPPQPMSEPPRPGAAARALVSQAGELRSAIAELLVWRDRQHGQARQTFEAAREDLVLRELRDIPISRLREALPASMRLGVLERAGYATVGDVVRARPTELTAIPRVGPQTARQVVAAARRLAEALGETTRVRFDPGGRPRVQTDLLAALRAYEDVLLAVATLPGDPGTLGRALAQLLPDATVAASRLKMLFIGPRRRAAAREAFTRLAEHMREVDVSAWVESLRRALDATVRAGPRHSTEAELWRDYAERAVAYNGLLIEVAELAPDLAADQGHMPTEIAERVRGHPLDLSAMTVPLRGYQEFGAKYALVRQRAILGDEMGLGKTIEALAVMCHLHAGGARHFLVVCPASVLVNWMNEIHRHTRLSAHRLHGPDRDRGVARWWRLGGVGVTTFDALRTLRPLEGPDGDLSVGLLVVDEAHYVKNPEAARTRAVLEWIAGTRRVLFMTGTPMENRVAEFRTLAGHLNPDVAARVADLDGILGATAFRTAVAGVYLRRNVTDVLQELPPRIEVEEWVELGGPEQAAYRAAVAARNFMAMRQAAYATGPVADRIGSAKLARLIEIVEEAGASGHKVVVFSQFHSVLRAVTAVLGDLAMGPLDGSVPAGRRQALVDAFGRRAGPAVLVGQITAAGVGLNIQAASVVVLAEPQLKPTLEEQAIARCHRLGQIHRVRVYRLLADNTVDQRIREILADKARLFDAYARPSEIKDVTPDAVDVSDPARIRELAMAVADQRRIIDMELRRLRLDSLPPD